MENNENPKDSTASENNEDAAQAKFTSSSNEEASPMTTLQTASPRTTPLRQQIDEEKARRATQRLRELASKVPRGLPWAHYSPEDIKKDLGSKHV
jgi:hypothetical protein